MQIQSYSFAHSDCRYTVFQLYPFMGALPEVIPPVFVVRGKRSRLSLLIYFCFLHSVLYVLPELQEISARMTDRYNIHSQLEHLQSKYIGTGHADTSKWEWLVNQHRDSYCSYMGHFDLLNYFSVAENESKARVRFNLMEKMLQPCGPPADKPDDA
ncbi:hypothetical protein JOB18_009028 [Solea senegalensis]|uniref:Splicing factor 3B subunit 5 n=1 Tax=Solea senegalensis TaxID=28829 RepID=A0AAV6S5I2_SOLSE|nr:hypothetical protein JOB18_009028 [Solea senegalensis]